MTRMNLLWAPFIKVRWFLAPCRAMFPANTGDRRRIRATNRSLRRRRMLRRVVTVIRAFAPLGAHLQL